MKVVGFYNSINYKERQSEIAKKNWQRGIYDSLYLYKRERKQCVNPYCKEWFEIKPAEPKKFCSRKCAAQVNNPKRNKIPFGVEEKLRKLYQKGFSMQEISDKTGWKYGKIVYWMKKFSIPRRSTSEAIYVKCNPDGDPFKIKENLTKQELELRGLGVGLYWGEGNKASDHSVRLGNSDPKLIRLFREFLIKICRIKKRKLKYSLLLFNDAPQRDAISFWNKELELSSDQIKSITSLKPRGKGTYKKKSMTGVLIIEFCNTKLKKEIDKMIEIL